MTGIKVNPFVIPIPRELQKNAETRAFFEYFIQWAHDMWARSGGGDDAIEELYTINTFETTPLGGRVSSVIQEIEYLKARISTVSGQLAAAKDEIKHLEKMMFIRSGGSGSPDIDDIRLLSVLKQGA